MKSWITRKRLRVLLLLFYLLNSRKTVQCGAKPISIYRTIAKTKSPSLSCPSWYARVRRFDWYETTHEAGIEYLGIQPFECVFVTYILKRYHIALAVTKRTKNYLTLIGFANLFVHFPIPFLCHLPLTGASYFRACGRFEIPTICSCKVAFQKHIYKSQFDVLTLSPCECALLANPMMLEYALETFTKSYITRQHKI